MGESGDFFQLRPALLLPRRPSGGTGSGRGGYRGGEGRRTIPMAVNEPIRDRRRQALIKATIAVIAKHGASGTTVERVARKAGVSVGLMNFHFDSKERLFRETFRHLSEEYEEVWQQNLLIAGTGSRARLRQM